MHIRFTLLLSRRIILYFCNIIYAPPCQFPLSNSFLHFSLVLIDEFFIALILRSRFAGQTPAFARLKYQDMSMILVSHRHDAARQHTNWLLIYSPAAWPLTQCPIWYLRVSFYYWFIYLKGKKLAMPRWDGMQAYIAILLIGHTPSPIQSKLIIWYALSPDVNKSTKAAFILALWLLTIPGLRLLATYKYWRCWSLFQELLQRLSYYLFSVNAFILYAFPHLSPCNFSSITYFSSHFICIENSYDFKVKAHLIIRKYFRNDINDCQLASGTALPSL